MPQVIRVALEKGSMSIYQTPNPGEFAFGDSVPIILTGFPSNSKVTAISVYQNATVNGADAKGTLIGTWNASNPSVEPESELSFSVDARGVVSIEDTDEDADERFQTSRRHALDQYTLEARGRRTKTRARDDAGECFPYRRCVGKIKPDAAHLGLMCN